MDSGRKDAYNHQNDSKEAEVVPSFVTVEVAEPLRKVAPLPWLALFLLIFRIKVIISLIMRVKPFKPQLSVLLQGFLVPDVAHRGCWHHSRYDEEPVVADTSIRSVAHIIGFWVTTGHANMDS